jgi:two-component system chemotaxis response regulator CheY
VLIVDDSAIVRRRLREILEKSGHEVIAEAADFDDAIHCYKQFPVDLVTMDIQMPGKNGIEAVKIIREIDPEAKVIMISSVEQKDLIFEAIKNGAKNYIVKPFSEEKVQQVVKATLPGGFKPQLLQANQANQAKQANPGSAAGNESKNQEASREKTEPEGIKLVDPHGLSLPFDVVFSNGKIVVTLFKYVTNQTRPFMMHCLQGLLCFIGTKYVVVFEKTSIVQEEAIDPFIDFIRIVRQRKGTIAVVSEDVGLSLILKSKLGMDVHKSVADVSW